MAKTSLLLLVFAVFAPALRAAPSSLAATYKSQLVQNRRADKEQLGRFQDLEMLRRYVRLKLLEPVPASTSNYYLHKIPRQYRYLRPWAKLFLERLSQQFRARFGRKLRVTSLTRTAAYQRRLQRRNVNAAAATGDRRSAHLTGSSLDISKKGMTGAQRRWMRRVLSLIRGKGYLFAIEEFSIPNFHVMVYKNYPEYVEALEANKNARAD